MHTELMNYISRMLDITHDEKVLNGYTLLKHLTRFSIFLMILMIFRCFYRPMIVSLLQHLYQINHSQYFP
jgi:hypothetical protein